MLYQGRKSLSHVVNTKPGKTKRMRTDAGYGTVAAESKKRARRMTAPSMARVEAIISANEAILAGGQDHHLFVPVLRVNTGEGTLVKVQLRGNRQVGENGC